MIGSKLAIELLDMFGGTGYYIWDSDGAGKLIVLEVGLRMEPRLLKEKVNVAYVPFKHKGFTISLVKKNG